MRIGASRQKYSPWLVVHFNKTEIIFTGTSGSSTLSCVAYFDNFDTTYNFSFTVLGNSLVIPGDRQQWVFVPSTRNIVYLNEGGPLVLNRRSDGYLNYFPLIRLKRSPPALITGVDTDDYGTHVSVSQDGQNVVVGGAGNSTTTSLSISGIVLPGWWTFDNDSTTWANVQQTAQCVPYPAIGNYDYIVNSNFSGMNLNIPSTNFYSYPVMSYNGKSFSVFSKYLGNATTGVAGTLLRYSRASYSASWVSSGSILNLGDLFLESSATLVRGEGGTTAIDVKLIDNFYKSDSHLFLWAKANMRFSQSGFGDTFKYFTHIIPYELSNSTWVRSSTIPIYSDRDSGLLNYVYVTQVNNNWYLTRNRNESPNYYVDVLKIKDSSWTVTQTVSTISGTYDYTVGSLTYSASIDAGLGGGGNVNLPYSTAITHDMRYMAITSGANLVNLFERNNGTWQYTGHYPITPPTIGQSNNGYNPVLAGLMDDRIFVMAAWAATAYSPGIILFRQYYTECN